MVCPLLSTLSTPYPSSPCLCSHRVSLRFRTRRTAEELTEGLYATFRSVHALHFSTLPVFRRSLLTRWNDLLLHEESTRGTCATLAFLCSVSVPPTHSFKPQIRRRTVLTRYNNLTLSASRALSVLRTFALTQSLVAISYSLDSRGRGMRTLQRRSVLVKLVCKVYHLMFVLFEEALLSWTRRRARRKESVGASPSKAALVAKPQHVSATSQELSSTCFGYEYKHSDQVLFGSDSGKVYRADADRLRARRQVVPRR